MRRAKLGCTTRTRTTAESRYFQQRRKSSMQVPMLAKCIENQEASPADSFHGTWSLFISSISPVSFTTLDPQATPGTRHQGFQQPDETECNSTRVTNQATSRGPRTRVTDKSDLGVQLKTTTNEENDQKKKTPSIILLILLWCLIKWKGPITHDKTSSSNRTSRWASGEPKIVKSASHGKKKAVLMWPILQDTDSKT